MQTLQGDYFAAYRSLKLTRDANGRGWRTAQLCDCGARATWLVPAQQSLHGSGPKPLFSSTASGHNAADAAVTKTAAP